MITDKVDISGLNRIQLQELRDEVAFELALHDAELRAFYGINQEGNLVRIETDEDVWCPICDEYDAEGQATALVQAHALLLDGDKGLEERIEGAVEILEDVL